MRKKKSVFTILQEVFHQKAKALQGLRTNTLLLFWFSEIRSDSIVQDELELTMELKVALNSW